MMSTIRFVADVGWNFVKRPANQMQMRSGPSKDENQKFELQISRFLSATYRRLGNWFNSNYFFNWTDL